MPKKIGHDYNRDPYPWDSSEKPASTGEWMCCGMKLPSTFNVCPICEKNKKLAEEE